MAKSSEKEYSFRDWRRDLSTDSGATRILATIGVAVFVSLFFLSIESYKDDKDVYQKQAVVAEMFDVTGSPAARVAQRRELAGSILTVKRYSNKIKEFSDPTVQQHLRATAQTGEPIDLHPAKPSLTHKFLKAALVWIIIMGGLASLALGALHCAHRYHKDWLIIAHPWNKPWAWLLPLGAPWLIPFLLGSLCRGLWYDRHEVAQIVVAKFKKSPKDSKEEPAE